MTVQPIAAAGSAATRKLTPEWLRLPRTGEACPFSGLRRSRLNELILPCPANDYRPPVKSIVLRQRGKVKGIRLVSYDSLMSYLHRQDQDTQRGGVIR
jgi:hypothetical protein